MGKILIPGGGGGADLDVITATAPDVRKNKVIVDKDGEPLAGVMNEQAGGTFMPGTSDRVLVPANTFVTSAIIMKGDPNLVAGNIKKDVPIFGVMGSHSGYVTDPSDLYLRGNNPAGFTQVQYASFESGGILHQSTYLPMVFKTSKVYNFTGYTTLAITYYIVSAINRGSLRMTARVYRDNNDYQGESTIGISAGGTYTQTIKLNPQSYAPGISLTCQTLNSGSWAMEDWAAWVWQIRIS